MLPLSETLLAEEGPFHSDLTNAAALEAARVEIGSAFIPFGHRNTVTDVARPSQPQTDGFAKVKASKRQKRLHPLLRGAEKRTVRERGRDIYTGDVPLSFGDVKLLGNEGMIEGDFWTVVNFSEEWVKDAFAQPFELSIEIFGAKHRWVPDAMLCGQDRRDLLVEIKPLKVVNFDERKDPENAKFIKAWLAALK